MFQCQEEAKFPWGLTMLPFMRHAFIVCGLALAVAQPSWAQRSASQPSNWHGNPSKEMELLWDSLAGDDAGKAYRAIWDLVAAKDAGVHFLREHLPPVTPADAQRVSQLLAELDDRQFGTRAKAARELEKLGSLARPAMREALAGKPSLEARRRLEELLSKLEGPVTDSESLRAIRAVEVVEHAGTSASKELLKSWSGGAPGSRLTQEAKDSLQRLQKRAVGEFQPDAPAGAAASKTAADSPPTDVYGDPLPAAAVARLGTIRFRGGAPLSSISLSADGKILATSNRDTITLWDAASGKELRRLSASYFGVESLAFAPNGKTLASTGHGPGVFIWEVATGRKVRELPGGGSRSSLVFSADGKILAAASEGYGRDSPITVWDVFAGQQLRQLTVVHNHLVHAALSPDGRRLASWGNVLPRGNDQGQAQELARTMQLWDVETGKEIRRFEGSGFGTSGAAFSPDGKMLAAAHWGTISLWETDSGKLLRTFLGRQDIGAILRFSPDGKTLVGVSPEGVVQIWEVNTGKRVALCEGPRAHVSSLVFDAAGRILVCANEGQAIRLWQAPSGRLLFSEAGHSGSVSALSFSTDGKLIFSAASDGTARTWDVATAKELRRFDLREEEFGHREFYGSALALSPGGDYLVAGSMRGSLRLRELGHGKVVADVPGYAGPQGHALFSPDGALLAVFDQRGRGGAKIAILDVASGAVVRSLDSQGDDIKGLAFAPDNALLAVASEARNRANRGVMGPEIQIWNLSTGKPQGRIQPAGMVSLGGMVFSSDRGFLTTAAFPVGIDLWDAASGRQVRKLLEVKAWITCPPVYSPDGRTLAFTLTARDNARSSIQLLEAASGKLRYGFPGHAGFVHALAFSPDGALLASAGDDTTILLWDVSGREKANPISPGVGETADLETPWQRLASRDLDEADAAAQQLAAKPHEAVALIRQRLQPLPARKPLPAPTARLLRDLDDDQVAVREQATRDLEKLGRSVQGALEETLEDQPSAEVRRRIERLLRGIEEPSSFCERLRPPRAVHVLESIGTAQAREVLVYLSQGRAEATLTRQAKTALEQLAR
jgi:WD40 repeat protein